ncbi:MAG: sigma-70 family RNA polymerase sigma factor [Bacteroidota bacterium]
MSQPMPVQIRTQHLSDDALISRILHNQQSHLFSHLMDRYKGPLWGLGKQINIPYVEIDDLIQVSFIKAYQKLHTFRGDSRFSSWLFRIFINECNMWRRKNRKFQLQELPVQPTDDMISHHTPEDVMVQNEQHHYLQDAIEDLPEKYRTVFVMRELEGRKSKEVAKELGLTDSNVKVRFLRSKLMLQDKLATAHL